VSQHSRRIVVDLPRPPRPDEVVGLNVTTGPLPLGAEIRLSTASGTYIGSATSFTGTDRSSNLVFQLALSGRDVDGSRLEIVAVMHDPGAAQPRAPSEAELVAVTAWIE